MRTIKRNLNVAPVDGLCVLVLIAALAAIAWADWRMAAGALGMAGMAISEARAKGVRCRRCGGRGRQGSANDPEGSYDCQACDGEGWILPKGDDAPAEAFTAASLVGEADEATGLSAREHTVRREHAAIHEASHVVVAIALGVHVDSAWISADGKSGRTIALKPSAEQTAIIAAAGRVGEQMILGSVVDRGKKDEALVAGVAFGWEEAAERGRDILRSRLPAVRRLADALLERGRLGGSEMEALTGEFITPELPATVSAPALPPDAAALVERAEARAEKATPGPWIEYVARNPKFERPAVHHTGSEDDGCLAKVWGGQANAAFIAHARTDIPALCALVRRLNGQLGGLEQANREAHQGIAKLKAPHAREREGLEGDKAHMSEEIARLTREVKARVQERNGWQNLCETNHVIAKRATIEVEALRAEVARMRPVVEAALIPDSRWNGDLADAVEAFERADAQKGSPS